MRMGKDDFKPKYTLRDKEKFADERERLGFLITEDMTVSGGTDIDWVIEHRGGFIIIENKTFSKNWINVPIGQMITLEQMYKKLNADGKCHMFIFGFEEDADYKNPESLGWYFTMEEWLSGKVGLKSRLSPKFGSHGVNKREMTKITLDGYRELMDVIWHEFEIPRKRDKKPKTLNFSDPKKKITSKSKPQDSTSMKKPNFQKIDAQKKYPNVYERWKKSDDTFLKFFGGNESNKNSNEIIQELMQKFGRNRGAIVSRLNKMGFDAESLR